MIRIAAMYPKTEGKSFDMEYYKNNHLKLVNKRLSPLGLVRTELDSGIAGLGGTPAPYHAIGYLVFESMESFQGAFAEAGQEIEDDVPNYTNIEPVFQISDLQIT